MIDERSRDLRRLILRMMEAGGRGHLGPAASLVEILRVLYDTWLRVYPDHPRSNERDRLVLSKGHGCLALYSILADKKFFDLAELDLFCRSGALLGGHPEIKVPGVEASTGALGHGLSIGVGMALAALINNQQHRVCVILGDGEINEGSVWEAAMSASKHKLSNLVVFIDYNKLQSYGLTSEVMPLEPLVSKWCSFGFETKEVDGHDVSALQGLVKQLPFSSGKPSAVICHTVKGKGFGIAEGKPEWHHVSRLSSDVLKELHQSLDNPE